MKNPQNDELVFLPLGGSNEVGMNLNLYGFGPPRARKWLVVDMGITFGDQTMPGIEIITPDPTYLEEIRDDVVGIFLTHAHEDHIGALGWLWPRVKAPVYATPFTAFLIREKLRDKNLLDKVKITEVPLSGRLQLGPFDIELITLTHSIPEPNGMAIRTPLGTVLHTGDWKIDPQPMIGQPTDVAKLERIGDEGVLAMVCDSTNVFQEGSAGSEADARVELNKLIATLKGKVAVGCFASNVARMDSVIRAAQACGRRVCLLGRSMHRMTAAARSVGLLEDLQPFVPDTEAKNFPADHILFLCTGSQGEDRAALSRIAQGSHPHVRLGQGDSVVFSSRVIPGNDIPIRLLQDALSDRGVRIYTERDHPGIHVSGHPCRDELAQMYRWVRPKIAIPTHGERRHLIEHLAFAREHNVPEALAPRNGDVVRLAPGPAAIVDEAPSGRLFLDGNILTPENSEPLRERRHAAANGVLMVAVTLSPKNKLAADAEVRAIGLPAETDYPIKDVLEDLAEDAEDAIEDLSPEDRADDTAVRKAVGRALKRTSQRIWSRRPVVETLVTRL